MFTSCNQLEFQRHISNLVEDLRWSFSAKIVKALKPLIIFTEKSPSYLFEIVAHSEKVLAFQSLLSQNLFFITYHIVRLTISHHLFLEFWLVNTWFFAHWRHQRAVTRLENVRQLNIRRGKKLGSQLSHRQPHIKCYFVGIQVFVKLQKCTWRKNILLETTKLFKVYITTN